MSRELTNLRRRTVESIRRKVAPHLWESGYRTPLDRSKGLLAGSRAYRIWCPLNAAGRPAEIEVKGLRSVEAVEAITEDGVMVNSYGGGCVTTGYGFLCVEDLIAIDKALDRYLPSTHPTKPASTNTEGA